MALNLYINLKTITKNTNFNFKNLINNFEIQYINDDIAELIEEKILTDNVKIEDTSFKEMENLINEINEIIIITHLEDARTHLPPFSIP